MTIESQDQHNVHNVGGEVVVIDVNKLQGPVSPAILLGDSCSQCPQVANLTVNKSSKVHIGPKFVSVTQNASNNEVVKGRILGLEVQTSRPSRRCRSGVVVFACWASFVACSLCALILTFITPHQKLLDIGLDQPWYLRRADWQAMPAYSIEYLNIPVKYVVFGHSAQVKCIQKFLCIQEVLKIQQDHLRRDFLDIGPNFLVGGEGSVFEGRGANICSAMVMGWNKRIISIMFMGDYTTDILENIQIENVKLLLDVLVEKGVLVSDYEILGNCQIETHTYSPGINIMNKINTFPHWNPENATYCLKS